MVFPTRLGFLVQFQGTLQIVVGQNEMAGTTLFFRGSQVGSLS